jgi:hypothetical protein
VADAIEKRRDEVEARLRNPNEAPEMLDRVAIALMDDLHSDHHVKEGKDRNGRHESRQHLFPPSISLRHIAVSGAGTKGKSR